ncbi:MAG: TetR/AcrR family transcriptional regulator, partial [Stenotrophobium sp.]
IGDIAKAAKLSKGALYWHFHSKEELYLECLKRLHGIFNDYIFDVMRAEKDSIKGILTIFSGLAQLVQDPRVTNGIGGYWLIPSRSETASLVSTQRNFEAASVATLTSVFRRAAAEGRIDIGPDAEPMARAIISLVEAVVLPLRQQTPDEVREILRILAATLFKAYTKSSDVIALTRLI